MKKIIILMAVLILTCFTFSETFADQKEKKTTYKEWIEKFEELQPNISRLEAEEIIEKIRGVKSTYSLYAMDTHDIVVYKLGEKYTLIVWYQPGFPAEKTIKHGNFPAEDGKYLRHRVTSIH